MIILIKLPFIIAENFLFTLFPSFRRVIESVVFNPYFFGKKHNDYSEKLYLNFRKLIDGHIDLKDKIVLELGPGGSLGFGLLALRDGAKKYYAIDEGNHLKRDKNINKYKDQIEFINIKQDSRYKLKSHFVDVIYSCAVLEHVHDLDLCFSEMNRVLKKGGYMNHQVDLRDHIFDQRSIWFLKIPEFLFKFLFGKTGGYVNRKRFSEYGNLFDKYNLEVVRLSKKVNGCVIDEKLKRRYVVSDLKVASFNILLRKKLCVE